LMHTAWDLPVRLRYRVRLPGALLEPAGVVLGAVLPVAAVAMRWILGVVMREVLAGLLLLRSLLAWECVLEGVLGRVWMDVQQPVGGGCWGVAGRQLAASAAKGSVQERAEGLKAQLEGLKAQLQGLQLAVGGSRERSKGGASAADPGALQEGLLLAVAVFKVMGTCAAL
jgi:hypothetical protein